MKSLLYAAALCGFALSAQASCIQGLGCDTGTMDRFIQDSYGHTREYDEDHQQEQADHQQQHDDEYLWERTHPSWGNNEEGE